jgi:hypothetical protein
MKRRFHLASVVDVFLRLLVVVGEADQAGFKLLEVDLDFSCPGLALLKSNRVFSLTEILIYFEVCKHFGTF